MAQYQHLPVYRITYELLQRITMVIKEFPKDYKYTVGQRLQEEVIGLVVLIYKANSATTDRAAVIATLLERLQVVELLIRLAQDMRIMTKKQYASLIEMTQSLNKQAEGWRKSALRKS